MRTPLLVIVGWSLLTGCPNRPCSVDPGHPFSAVGTIECPEDQLCLRGECVYACDLSSDGLMPCQSSADCDTSFAFCKSGRCTACPEGTACVPTIGVCRPIELEPELPAPPCADNPVACDGHQGQPYPLDGGYVYEGIDVGSKDTGNVMPVQLPPTHAGFVAVSRRNGFDGGPSGVSDQIRVVVYDLVGLDPGGRRWRVDLDPPRLAEPLPDAGIFELPPACVLQDLSVPAAVPEAIDFGVVTIATSTVDAYPLAFDLGAGVYVGPASVPTAIFQPSVLFEEPNELTVRGPGRVALGGAWPATVEKHHVPFTLVLSSSTAADLAQGIEVGPTPGNLVLDFLPYRCTTPTNCDTNAANVGGETVRLTVRADSVELRCELLETATTPGELLVPAEILGGFRDRVGASGDYPLVLERVRRAQVEMPASAARIEMVVAVSNTHESRLRIR